MVKQCFRCGEVIEGFQNGGQVTIAGFYDNKRLSYYNTFLLCRPCHEKLTKVIERYVYRYEGDANGTRDDS